MNLVPLIQSIIRGAWRRRFLMVMPLLIVIPISVAGALLWPSKYETSALILLQEYNGLSGDVPAYVRAQDLRDKVKSLQALMSSEFILRRILRKFDAEPGKSKEPTERDLEDYRKRLSVEQVGTQFVQVTLTGNKKEGLSQELSAILASLFESLLSSNDTSLDATTFLMRTRRQQLNKLEARLKSLETASGNSEKVLSEQRQALSAADGKVTELTAVVEREGRALNDALNRAAPELGLAGQPADDIAAALKRELTTLKEPGKDNARSTAGKLQERTSIVTKLLKAAESLQNLNAQLAAAQSRQIAVRTDLEKSGSTLNAREDWKREADRLRARYGQFENRLNDPSAAADIQLLKAPAQIQVIDTPKEPNQPRNSRMLILLGGTIAAFAMAGAFGFLAEQLDGSLRGPEMLKAATKLPVIAEFSSLASAVNERSPDGGAQLLRVPAAGPAGGAPT